MNDLIFSLNATLPVFLVMMIGYVFRRIHVISESFASQMNTFVFKIALPVNLFHQLCTVDVASAWDTKYVLYCAFTTIASILIAALLALPIRDRGVRGEFIQGSYRSSASLLGMVYIENIYGKSAMGPLMMIGCVPIYNIAAVIILMLTVPKENTANGGQASFGAQIKRSLIGIVTNPIIIGIAGGFVWALLKLPMPKMADKTLGYIGQTASPLGLLALGAMVDFKAIGGKIKPLLGATFLKLIGFDALFLPLAIALGWREDKLVALVIMLGSASTVTGFTMAKNMGHKGDLSAAVVMLTTLLSSLTLTFWIWLLRSRGFI